MTRLWRCIHPLILSALLVLTLSQPALRGQDLSASIQVEEKIKVFTPIVITCDLKIPEGTSPAYIWRLPPSLHKKVMGGGKTLHLWGPIGKYKVDVAVVLVDWEKKTVTQTETSKIFSIVSGDEDPDIPVDPDDPPPPSVDSDFKSLIKGVPEWVKGLDRDNKIQEAKHIGDAFTKLSSKSEDYENPRDFSLATRKEYLGKIGLQAYSDWRQPVFFKIEKELNSLRDGGKINSMKDWGKAWKSIGLGFKEVK